MGKRVLIVDDAAFMRMMLKDILTKNGYEVCGEAENGKKAVEKYGELHPNLVTMDITMPEMDGISALKAIRAEDSAARVVMCSAMGQQNGEDILKVILKPTKKFPNGGYFYTDSEAIDLVKSHAYSSFTSIKCRETSICYV